MKIVKYIILAVLAIAGVCIGAVSFLQRDIAAWHPAVAGADLPAVIPVRDFYADRRATWGHAVSASGCFVAYAGTKLTEQYMFIRDIDQDREITSIQKDGDFSGIRMWMTCA
jgi:hypothetical protein